MIHALHGNFGLPTDWDAVLPPDVPAKAWHLWEIRRHHPEARTLTGFASWFNDQIAALPTSGPRLLAGYSLGGRLALHVLLERPALWQGVVLLSTHPGLETAAGRAGRRAHDAAWRERCRVDPWESVLKAWNAQPVLADSQPSIDSAPAQVWRAEIAGAFGDWSLGSQEFLLPFLTHSRVPVLAMAGERDAKFLTLAGNLRNCRPGHSLRVISGAGHRLLQDSSGAVLREIAGFYRTSLPGQA